ncbi:MAG: NAD(P)H-dependent oxidoreductase [Saprospiraceae bacterium]|jgi:NAD(P)H-dependent FMN reductase|nr:NAD(P)H-dependent oxidoreductase [Saprospiraceae bacterium]MBP7922668.1 NAD(P)H-dependent oxidoreductase [Saprospiraceae bacterium]MBP8095151.1 NAD(P)H-dependent oxidoreductase [Saprospiraceae bacterium]MBP8941695.1 NAD(P)H-dependent oxidoreductase [Saprospiraceae bacterium]MBP9745078.1 NAD(P)H-dependent oxidoreductase [Saprospiraceae bacterium]
MNDSMQMTSPPQPLRYLVFSASLREDSLNTRLAKLAAGVITKNGGIVDYATMSEFDSPSFNQDLEVKGIYPDQAERFRQRIESNDAFIISSPEYNGSLPGVLKNAIDWVSRVRPQPFNEKNALLMSASPSMAGGNRALWSLRMPLEHLGTRVFPNMFSLAMAHKAFSPEGNIADETLQKRFEENLVAFMSLVESSKHYPCIKKAWIEFMGEKTDLMAERTN